MHKKVSLAWMLMKIKTYLLLKLILVKKMSDRSVTFLWWKQKTYWEGQGGFGAKKKVKNSTYWRIWIKGIVSDETKTKIGKDFYDLYYYLYNDYKINSKEIVVIIEEFSSRNTKIMININNEVVYEF
jgi:hypothetical protein